MTGVRYCTREQVSAALGDTARSASSIDRATLAASREVEHLTHRRFYPTTATRYFAWPPRQQSESWRLWLDDDELISVSSITSGGAALSDYFLEPANSGPPFTHIDVDLAGPDAFSAGSTHQRAVAVAGDWGHSNTQVAAGALAANVASTTTTTITVTDGSLVGVGDTLTIDTERLLVTERTWVTSVQTGSLAADRAAVTLAVADGSAFAAGEALLIGAEQLLVTAVAGNNLIVKRAQAGSVLAAHTTATIFTSRTLTVERGALGTTAAVHLADTAVTRLEPPAQVHAYALAMAINQVLQESGGYSAQTGSGDTKAAAPGGGLDALRKTLYASLARKARMRSI